MKAEHAADVLQTPYILQAVDVDPEDARFFLFRGQFRRREDFLLLQRGFVVAHQPDAG